ncbi:Protein of unknown function (DUF3131) [Synechococcus sp. PCC 7502]|uniref:DUF3131 domain-containing protein n=1 Tax=Synechococcus sp. PCC 7502 TaxID=1173263 RepID=UPI00029FBD04|nr:DUF3131 domain-containing protein [Synechococcus sp. PCC 7502]AFY72471.1 Protein of unknown function (DUF3131) [Synechococcus sp. PCC 7502]
MSIYPRWVKGVAMFLIGIIIALYPSQLWMNRAIAQLPNSTNPSICSVINAPLTTAEQEYARTAWQYFVNNYQPSTGFVNAANNYPSASLWDLGNYLVALNTARWLNLVSQAEFDQKLNRFLNTLGSLKLFDDALPNKVYNTANAQMSDYGNNPTPRGIGWSALDIGRILTAFHIIRTCHPQYADWLKGIIGRWQLGRSLANDQLYGATVTQDGKTLLVQEGRLGYEEYAVRGYELWGFKANKAKSYQPFKFVDIYGIKIPVDTRDYQTTKANNYVVSESYILDGIEFGWDQELADYAARVLEVQRQRYLQTGQLTAVTEDNIDEDPRFVYNTVYANGVPWAAITDENKPYPQFRSISTKAAFGWHYLYPTNAYAQQVFNTVTNLYSPNNEGYYAGQYETTKQPNKALTGNTNGLILEILYYKARGNIPLIKTNAIATPAKLSTINQPISNQFGNQARANSNCPKLNQPLSQSDRRYAQAAWQYFQRNTQATGLVNDRSDFKGATIGGIGDYLAALRSAKSLQIIGTDEFNQRLQQLLTSLRQIPLFGGELPNRSYDPWSLQPVDYGGNPVTNGTGWSAVDLGRLLSAFYGLKVCFPEYADSIDRILLDWSYLQVVKDQALFSGIVKQDQQGRLLTRVIPEVSLGYSEYAARAFQLWGFDVERTSVTTNYRKVKVEGFDVPISRGDALKSAEIQLTVGEPFLRYGLEFGFDPAMKALATQIFQAQAERFNRTKLFTTAYSAAISSPPYILHSTVVGNEQPWANLDDSGNSVANDRLVSAGVAFALYALYPNDPYSQQLWSTVTDLYNPQLGYYEGYYEKSKERENNQTAKTNSLILQALLYRATNQQTLLFPSKVKSLWIQTIASGNISNGLHGLPSQPQPTARFIRDGTNPPYWESIDVLHSVATSPAQPTPKKATQPSPQVLSGLPYVDLSKITTQPSLPIPKKAIALIPEDQQIAKQAWKYFERNWNPQTGMVNAVDGYEWTTLWDQGSALMGLHAAMQLGVITPAVFNQRLTKFLNTLDKLTIPKRGLPNKAYSTSTAQMRQLDNTPDPNGISGWSALDTARLLMSLHVLRVHYPEYKGRINTIVQRWQLTKLVKDGWLYGQHPDQRDRLQYLQEGRLGYEQYAAHCLKFWNIEAINALNNPPTQTINLDGIPLEVDRRNFKTSGASNHLTSDPYVLWGLEIGWNNMGKRQAGNLYRLQAQRYQRSKIITAVNEDSLDRPPHFLYYSVYVDGQPWQAVSSQGKPYPQLKFTSTKAAFGWSALMKDDYALTLRNSSKSLTEPDRGYFSGKYENPNLGINKVIDDNTNGIILESLLYKARGSIALAS